MIMGDARGFTLIEMMVAISVFAMLALAGGMMVQQSVGARDAMADRGGRLAALQMARAAMKADLGQLVSRPVRDSLGGAGVVFAGGQSLAGEPVLMLVRGGWENPGNLEARGGLQYVEYDIADGRLIRRARLRVDPTTTTPVRERVLLEDVSDFSISFLSNGQWSPDWRAQANAGRLPEAVAIDFMLADLGRLRQLFLTAQGAG